MKRRLSLITSLLLLAAVGLFVLPQSQATGTKTAAKNLTFSKDVAPIFFKNCAECHRAGEAAPFSVLSYKDVRPWAKAIKEKVVTREMPPWHAYPHFGKFENEARLTQAEIDECRDHLGSWQAGCRLADAAGVHARFQRR